MNRRTFLTGATGILTLLSGCISERPIGNSSELLNSTDTTKPTVLLETNKTVAVNHQGITQETASIQQSTSSSDPIRVHNKNDESKTIEITVRVKDRPTNLSSQETYAENSPDNPIFQNIYTIAANTRITFQLLRPGTYEVKLKLNQQSAKTIEYVTDSCNFQTLEISIIKGNSIDWFQSSTERACVSA